MVGVTDSRSDKRRTGGRAGGTLMRKRARENRACGDKILGAVITAAIINIAADADASKAMSDPPTLLG